MNESGCPDCDHNDRVVLSLKSKIAALESELAELRTEIITAYKDRDSMMAERNSVQGELDEAVGLLLECEEFYRSDSEDDLSDGEAVECPECFVLIGWVPQTTVTACRDCVRKHIRAFLLHRQRDNAQGEG